MGNKILLRSRVTAWERGRKRGFQMAGMSLGEKMLLCTQLWVKLGEFPKFIHRVYIILGYSTQAPNPEPKSIRRVRRGVGLLPTPVPVTRVTTFLGASQVSGGVPISFSILTAHIRTSCLTAAF